MFFALFVVALLFVAVGRRLDRYAYLKLGEEYERQALLRREWKVGIPYDPRRMSEFPGDRPPHGGGV